MGRFSVDYNILKKLLIKKKLRTKKRMAGVNAYIKPIVYLYNKFVGFYNSTLYELAHTSQVVFIQAVLNDRWDNADRRIVIIDGPDLDATLIYLTAENKNRPFLKLDAENAPLYLYLYRETADQGPDFIIQIPVDIVYDQAELIALVDKYKLPGKLYIIQQV